MLTKLQERDVRDSLKAAKTLLECLGLATKIGFDCWPGYILNDQYVKTHESVATLERILRIEGHALDK